MGTGLEWRVGGADEIKSSPDTRPMFQTIASSVVIALIKKMTSNPIISQRSIHGKRSARERQVGRTSVVKTEFHLAQDFSDD
jgi:hypothetical protein